MLTYTDIIRKTLAGVPNPGTYPFWTPGLDFPSDVLAWVHPDKCSILFLDALDRTMHDLNPETTHHADWLSTQLRSALLIDSADLIPEKHILAGKQRKLWFNRTHGTPIIIDTLPIEDRFVKRYSYKRTMIYQAMEKPHGYFFMTENMIPYAYALPARINLETAHDWRV